MGEPKFTPAPWSAEEPMEGWLVRANDPNRAGKRFLICDIGPSHRSRADEVQAHANAHLIAAAPALFEALSELLGHTGCDHLSNDDLRELVTGGHYYAPAIVKARAALAQALGEPNPSQPNTDQQHPVASLEMSGAIGEEDSL